MCCSILSFIQVSTFLKKWELKRTCPNTENFFNNMISFPFHTWMSNKDFEWDDC